MFLGALLTYQRVIEVSLASRWRKNKHLYGVVGCKSCILVWMASVDVNEVNPEERSRPEEKKQS